MDANALAARKREDQVVLYSECDGYRQCSCDLLLFSPNHNPTNAAERAGAVLLSCCVHPQVTISRTRFAPQRYAGAFLGNQSAASSVATVARNLPPSFAATAAAAAAAAAAMRWRCSLNGCRAGLPA
eukprot:6214191-Pleurochrysis_carterae.AAC.1